MLHPKCIPPRIQKPKNENRKWLPLFLPRSGKLAHNSVLSLKRLIAINFAGITFAHSVTKLRTLLPSFSTTTHSGSKFENVGTRIKNLFVVFACFRL